MSAFGRMHKATAVVPLAVLSAAWTASLVSVGAGSASAEGEGTGVLPDGTTIPTEAVQAPASIGTPVTRASAVEDVSAGGIPEAALAAYQRAEAVINKADAGCNITWQLIAAIGRVESDHGRYDGNTLSSDGLAQPGIYGIALDGRNNTQRIVDTDGGEYDNDTRFDRAVGPMQFIPSTWAVVGVDGDSDGARNPQDVDDAALATAVYLCSGDDDLSGEKGQRAAVYRYNRSNEYVDLVLDIMQAYLDGDFSSVPNSTPSSVLIPEPGPAGGGADGGAGGGKGDGGDGKDRGGKSSDGGGSSSDGGSSGGGSTQATPTPTPTPTQAPTQSPSADPTKSATEAPTKTPSAPVPTTAVPTTVTPLPSPSLPTVSGPISTSDAERICREAGYTDDVAGLPAFTACVTRVLAGQAP